MFGLFKRIRDFFKRRQKVEGPVLPEPVQETHVSSSGTAYVELKEENPKKTGPQESRTERAQKTCVKCGAPNDTFVHMCWLCKGEI